MLNEDVTSTLATFRTTINLALDVEMSSKGSETGGFVNLFTVANRTRELLLQILMISEK